MKSININEIINKDVDGKVVMAVTKLKEILANGGNIWDAIIEYKPATEKYGHWYKVVNSVSKKTISTPKDLFTFIKNNFAAKRFTFITVSKTFTPNVIFDDHDHGTFIYQCSDKGSMNFMTSLVNAGYTTEPFSHNDDLIKVIDNVEKKVYVINKDLTITIEDFREQLFSVDDLAACICAGQKITLRNGLELTVKNCFMSVNLKHPGNDRFVIYSEEYSTIQSYLPIKGSNLDNDIVAVYDPFSKKKFIIHDDLTVSVAEDNPPAKEKEVTEEVIKDDLSWETYHPEVDDIIEKTSYPGAKFIITGKLYDNFIINSFDEGTPCLVRSEFLVEKYKRIALSRLYKK